MTPDDIVALHELFAWLKKHPEVDAKFRYDDGHKCWAVEIVPLSLGGAGYCFAIEPSIAVAVHKVIHRSKANIR